MENQLNKGIKSNQDVIQTLRTAHQNQTQLNLMADQKANILIGTLVLMFTVVLSRLITLVDLEKQLIIPIIVFIILHLTSLVITTLVLIPRNIKGNKNISTENMPNPLFFGYFTKFSEQEYEKFLNQFLQDNESARSLLIKDIYQIGKILKRKYTFLRLAYFFALGGVILPFLLWVVLHFIIS